MIITRVSPLTGRTNQMDINVSMQQINDWLQGGLIQHVMPDATIDEREFIINGMTPEDWGTMPEEEY